MKPAVKEREISGTLEGEVIEWDFNKSSRVHLQNLLIDAYKDKEMAVLREYSINALDSHIAAGNPDPILVTLPTKDDPTLVIEDEGVGLSYADIRTLLSEYGASTKRESNDFTGSLGIGSKSGLAYAEMFTMTAVKDGLRNTLIANRDTRGGGQTVVIERDVETGEPNGVKVQIPCAYHNNFAEKARILFQYWDAGTVLVDGEFPERFEGRYIAEGLYVRNRVHYWEPKHVVVMGSVPYPFNADMLGMDIGQKHDIVAFVPLGTLEFTPSREEIYDHKENKAALFRIGQTLKDKMVATAQEDIDAAENPAMALRKAAQWSNDLPKELQPKDGWTYRKQEIPLYFEAPAGMIGADGTVLNRTRWTVVRQNNTSKKVSEHSKLDKVPYATAGSAIWFYGYDVQFTPNHRRRLDAWMEVHEDLVVPEHFILTAAKPDMTFLLEEQVYSWEEVKAMPLPKVSRAENGRLLGSYDAFVAGSSYCAEVLAADIDSDNAVFYYVGSQRKSKSEKTREAYAEPFMRAIRHFEKDATVVLIPETRVRKFLQQFPEAEEIRAAVQEHFNTWSATLTKLQRRALALHIARIAEELTGLDPNRILDPAIRDAIALSKVSIKLVLAQYERFRQVGSSLDLPTYENPLDHYPLLPDAWRRQRRYGGSPEFLDQCYTYLNAAYRAHRIDSQSY